MLEIIGYLGCVYLFIKGLELAGREHQNGPTRSASVLAILASLGFLFAFASQGENAAEQLGRAYTNESGLTDEEIACSANAQGDALLECLK